MHVGGEFCLSKAVEIKEAVAPDVLRIPGITGIGVGKSSPEKINIYVKTLCPSILKNIPSQMGGIDVRVIETGKILALPLLQAIAQQVAVEVPDRASRLRPVVGGISAGHPLTSAGTLGTRVFDATTGEKLLLSNAHIFAPEGAREGDLIFQPGMFDGGDTSDKVAELLRWSKFPPDNDTIVDAAVARPLTPNEVKEDILNIGTVTKMAYPKINSVVRKSGRSSGLTSGMVVDTNASIMIDYGSFATTFTDQIIINPAIALSGDSGSLLVDEGNRAVGLVLAGSDKITVANKITNVAAKLNINFGDAEILGAEDIEGGSFWGVAPALVAVPLLFGLIKAGSKRKLRTGRVPASELKLKYGGS